MRIGFKEQETLISDCVRGLTDIERGRSYVVVIPPGFGEEAVVEAITKRLREHEGRPRFAVVAPDACEDTDQFIDIIHQQWRANGSLKLPRRERYTTNRFERLLDAAYGEPPPILIIKRFPKMIEAKIKPEILGRLHTAEECKPQRVRTLNLSPLHYDELRARWRRHNHVFCNSPYGFSHLRKENIEPVESGVAIEATVEEGVPRHIAERLIAWTGAYPEPLSQLIEEWRARGKPTNPRDLDRQLWNVAKATMARLLEWLGPEDDPELCRFVAEVGHGLGAEGWALATLQRHPWSRVLVSDDRLRADCLGPAALEIISRQAAERAFLASLHFDLGRSLYRRRQFRAVERMLHDLPEAAPPHLHVLRATAALMSRLAGEDAESFHVDARWQQLPQAIVEAETAYNRASLDFSESEQIHDRLTDIRTICDAVRAALAKGIRVVDRLCGLPNGDEPLDLRAAALLMLARIKIARAHPHHSAACDLLLHEPEQIFRAWAWIALRLNYYRAPELDYEAWNRVEIAFAETGIKSVRRPTVGENFPSFEVFARYSLALHELRYPSDALERPEPSMRVLSESLTAMGIRRDSAHADAFATEKVRNKFFAVADRWFGSFVSACVSHVTWPDLEEAVRPLPLVTEAGALEWIEE
jgi:hypothetical protein